MVIDYRTPWLLSVLRVEGSDGRQLKDIIYFDTEDGCCIASNGIENQKFDSSRWWFTISSLELFFSYLAYSIWE